MKLIIRALIKYIVDIAGLGILLFVSAGTIYFPAAWILIGSIMVLGAGYGIYMMRFHKSLLARRLMDTERSNYQIIIMGLSLLLLCSLLVISGLSYRYSFGIIPDWRYYISVLLLLIGIIIYISVISVNEYLSTAIKISENQKVVTKGPYGYVRHPMYTAVMLVFLAALVVLGSSLALLGSLLFFPLVYLRIKDEERLLVNYLLGYSEYTKVVKFRLIPFIW